jgi:hypothetical protein
MYDDSMIEDNNNGLNSIALVSVFTFDNCIVNKAAVGILSKPMISAHCHHLNLAATHWRPRKPLMECSKVPLIRLMHA